MQVTGDDVHSPTVLRMTIPGVGAGPFTRSIVDVACLFPETIHAYLSYKKLTVLVSLGHVELHTTHTKRRCAAAI